MAIAKNVGRADAYGGKVAYDVGAAYFRELERAGLTWAEMPEAWQSHYHHYGGLTWLGAGSEGVSLRRRAKQFLRSSTAHRHLRRARFAQHKNVCAATNAIVLHKASARTDDRNA